MSLFKQKNFQIIFNLFIYWHTRNEQSSQYMLSNIELLVQKKNVRWIVPFKVDFLKFQIPVPVCFFWERIGNESFRIHNTRHMYGKDWRIPWILCTVFPPRRRLTSPCWRRRCSWWRPPCPPSPGWRTLPHRSETKSKNLALNCEIISTQRQKGQQKKLQLLF